MGNRRRLEDLNDRMALVKTTLDKLEQSMERIELVTVIREPNTGMTADAYDGLRKQVIAAVNERMAHLQQLARFDASLQSGATPEELAGLVREWLEQSQLEMVEDIDLLDAFETVGPERFSGRRLLRAAYVDGLTGRVIRGGIVERVEEAPDLSEEQRAAAGAEDGDDTADAGAESPGHADEPGEAEPPAEAAPAGEASEDGPVVAGDNR
ncbi:MAG TPA: hypothetical protein VL988_01540 [Solirubrobacteraceae bacterium]|nr:hypothetical protein [Solirubrobacteraceae bacterium]